MGLSLCSTYVVDVSSGSDGPWVTVSKGHTDNDTPITVSVSGVGVSPAYVRVTALNGDGVGGVPSSGSWVWLVCGCIGVWSSCSRYRLLILYA